MHFQKYVLIGERISVYFSLVFCIRGLGMAVKVTPMTKHTQRVHANQTRNGRRNGSPNPYGQESR